MHVFGARPWEMLDFTPGEIGALWRYIDALNEDK